ncbi:MAG: hypothetical protein Q7T05_01485 [Dehalococcoidia bacterium]|nr:hypothetical protein [Dehalococcoidia bacterium]
MGKDSFIKRAVKKVTKGASSIKKAVKKEAKTVKKEADKKGTTK